MSEQLNEKQNGAIRLFEAMSGVDEKYLAACEDYKKTKPKGVVVFMQKYGKAVAAVLCLAVLGAGYVGMQQTVGTDKATTAMDSEMAAPAASAPAMQDVEMAEAPTEESETEGNEIEESLREDAVLDESIQNSTSAGSFYSDAKENVVGAESAKPEAGSIPTEEHKDKQETEADGGSSVVELTLEEAKSHAVVGKYVPDSWPEDGVFVDGWGSTEVGAEYAALFWIYDDTQDGFVVRVENLGVEVPEWVNSEIENGYIVYEADFNKEFVSSRVQASDADHMEENRPDGELGVLHKEKLNYVLVYFEGWCEVDDIWEMMQ